MYAYIHIYIHTYIHIHAHVQYICTIATRTYMCTFMHIATEHLHTAFYLLIAMAQIVAT